MIPAGVVKPVGAVKCGVCRHDCLLADGQVGVCGVRVNEGGTVKLLVYGKASSVCVDPIEKKPLFHVLPGSPVLSIGSIGCNFRCSFCQNWETSQALREPGGLREAIPLVDASPEQLVERCVESNIPAIAFTYNEPTILLEYALDTFKLAKQAGLTTVFVSNGYFSDDSLRKLHGLLDAINIDLKAFSEEFYAKQCGACLQHVLDAITSAHKMGFWIELTTLLVPTLNDRGGEVQKAAEWIARLDESIPWHLTAFHPDYKLTNLPPTPLATLERAYSTAREAGLNFVYTGNTRQAHEDTKCPDCNSLLVKRHGFQVKENKMKGGACQKCKKRIPGIW